MAKKSLRQRTKKIKLTKIYRGGYRADDGRVLSDAEGKTLLDNNKAVLASWKNIKSHKDSYEGQQYRGGRVQGAKRLKKLENGSVENQYGVVITSEERKHFDSLVNRVNKQRKKQIEAENALPRIKDGKPTGQSVGELRSMGYQSDFIISRRSKSLQGFETREQFEKEQTKLENILSGKFLDERTRLYKRNHMQALKNVFGDEAKDVIMKIRMMKPEEYRKLLTQSEDLEVSYVYDPSQRTGKLNAIRQALGMKEKEDDIETYY